jgi:hypothetical protein
MLYLYAHVDELLAVHATMSLESAIALLTIGPNGGLNDFCIGRERSACGQSAVHAIICMFVQLGELIVHPINKLWAINAGAMYVFGGGSHVSDVDILDKVHRERHSVNGAIYGISVGPSM